MITIGDIKLDTFVVLEDASVQCSLKMPECQLCLDYGKKIPVNIVDSQIAGSAPNVARGLARMKHKTAVVSVMGRDDTHELAMEVLAHEGVGTKFITTSTKAKSSYSVVLNYKGEKTILTSHVPRKYRLPNIDGPHWLYMSELGDGYEDLFRDLTRLVRREKILLGFNPGAVQIRDRKKVLFDLIKVTHLLVLNLHEAYTLTKGKTYEIHSLLRDLYRLGAEVVIITNGKEGAHAFDGQTVYFCPVFPAKTVESTGVGDAFSTGVIGALMAKLTLPEALRWGAVNAASVVSFVGPSKGLLSANQIKKRLKERPSFKTTTL